MTKLKHFLITTTAVFLISVAFAAPAFAEENSDTITEAAVSETITVGESRGKSAADSADQSDISAEANSNDSAKNQVSLESEDTESSSSTGLRSLGMFRTTAYCPCYGCSEGYGRHTCTGAIAKANHTIAVDPRVIPYGSKVVINGVVYTAEDRGGGVKGNHIDIFYDTHAQTRQYGSRHVEVFLIS